MNAISQFAHVLTNLKYRTVQIMGYLEVADWISDFADEIHYINHGNECELEDFDFDSLCDDIVNASNYDIPNVTRDTIMTWIDDMVDYEYADDLLFRMEFLSRFLIDKGF